MRSSDRSKTSCGDYWEKPIREHNAVLIRSGLHAHYGHSTNSNVLDKSVVPPGLRSCVAFAERKNLDARSHDGR